MKLGHTWTAQKKYDAAMMEMYENSDEEKRQKFLAEEAGKHKTAARVWYNLMEEVWPPENTEEYWLKTTDKIRSAWNESQDNMLLQSLLLMLHEYLGQVVKAMEEMEEGT